ncbi:MAG TPA: saccharopine dehydrogenase C-terminal domain-containing protein [Thermoanaerobaculia bacterium]|nr:saccharopine dehydrogenase C-terminal domain-containing protein [Thermoanaerobaculia bacterium]
MKQLVVLGSGLVGSAIARDLSRDEDLRLTVVDVSEANLERVASLPRVTPRRADLSRPQEIAEAVAGADAVVGAVPGRLGFQMLKTVIEAGKPICDISFSPEDVMQLEGLARDKGVTAIVDCGVSPGLSNLAIGRAASQLEEIDSAVIYVGGLPVERVWPYEYRIVFSATDVIEEYTRTARIIEERRLVTREALSEVELLDFPGVGTLEAFNTDGLRTLLSTVSARNMREKTLRYPGHADRMRMLRETGFFAGEPIDVKGASVVPRDFTERLLFRAWLRKPDEEELTVLRVIVEGPAPGGEARRFTYELFDRTDRATGMTSMARTTGFPCAIMARMLARGAYRDPGVRPPEFFGRQPDVYEHLVSELGARGVRFGEAGG